MDNEQHPIRIVIAAGHEAFRGNLRSLLALDERLEVVGEASDGAHAITVMLQHKPDVLLLDLSLPRMLDLQVSNLVASHLPSLRIVVLVTVLEKTNILEAFRLGAHAVLVKTTAPKPLFRSIRSVVAGGYWLRGDGVGILVQALREALGPKNGTPSPGDYGLTPRELDIVAKIIRGRSNKEVGEEF
jgi:DNA-binding NarL/FixJ family response regulator